MNDFANGIFKPESKEDYIAYCKLENALTVMVLDNIACPDHARELAIENIRAVMTWLATK